MKKILFMLTLMLTIFTFNVSAQTQWYRTKSYAFANIYNGRYVWGDWESSSMDMCFDLTNDRIIIYSPTTQIYKVYGSYNNGKMYTDNSGGRNIKFYVYDQDGDRGEVRLRVERNGNSQVYIDFNNCGWCYNVVRIR